MKVENQAIRDEAEADLSESFESESWKRKTRRRRSWFGRGSFSPKREGTKIFTVSSTIVACACTSRGRIDKSICNRTVCRERWHNIEPVCSLTLFDRRSVCFRRSTADVDRCREELEGPEQKRHHRGEGDEKASGRRASRHRNHLYYKQRETDQGS